MGFHLSRSATYATCKPDLKAIHRMGSLQVNLVDIKPELFTLLSSPDRLNLIQLGQRDPKTGKRLYFKRTLGREQMKEIYACVLHGMGLSHLTNHI